MTQAAQQPAKKQSASQRLDTLDNIAIRHEVNLQRMLGDIRFLRDSMLILNSKLTATLQLLQAGMPLTAENLQAAITQNNIEELAGLVQTMVDQGVFTAVDQVPSEINEGFVVLRELDKDGKVTQPRSQLLIRELPAEAQTKLIGTRVGDKVQVAEDKFTLEVLEIYRVNAEAAKEASQQEANA